MGMKPISINIDENALKLIDKGADKEQRSRSNFLQVAGTEKAKLLGVE